MRSSSMGSTAKPQAAGTLANATKGLWQKSLRDLITGIRSNKERQKDFMNKCLQDIRAEVRPPARPPTRSSASNGRRFPLQRLTLALSP